MKLFELSRIGVTLPSALLERSRNSARALGLAGCLTLATLPAFAASVVYTDSYTLTTTNQSMWSSGAQAGWSYDSGLLGAAWGTYGSSGVPSTFVGINTIEGSVDATIIPGIPSICGFGFCTPSTSPVTGDTRTGVALNGTTSGQVGLYVTAQANGGGINVAVPVTSSLTIGDAGTNGIFHVSGTNALGGGTITAIAPSFKAGLDGVLALNASVKGTGCLAGFGCTSTDTISLVNINKKNFSLLGLDTSQTDPVSIFGLGVPQIQFGNEYAYRPGEPPCQGPVTQAGQKPECPGAGPFNKPAIGVVQIDKLINKSGGTLDQGTLSLTTNQPVLRLTADVTGIAQYALGIGIDVLSPTVNVPLIGSLGGTIINVQAGIQFGLTQEFDFTPQLMATLLFDKPVTEFITVLDGYVQKCVTFLGFCTGFFVDDLTKPITHVVIIDRGTSVNVNLAQGADLRFTSDPGQLLGRTYFMGNNSFTSDSRVSIDPTLPIKAGCLTVDSDIPGIDGVEVCAFQEDFKTTDLLSFSVYKNTFSLGGFNSASFTLAGDTGSDPSGNGVPEPSTLWLALLAFTAMTSGRLGARARARLASH